MSFAMTSAAPAQRGRDGDEARAGGEVEHAASGDDVGVVEEVAGECLPAGPRERPERHRRRFVAVRW